ncbi:MAG: hypothetical protein Q7T51_01925 [Candidatus Moranbacteria bacterium]|nr:hypothetical protein [Candidatus Moranbacteria bacterium]
MVSLSKGLFKTDEMSRISNTNSTGGLEIDRLMGDDFLFLLLILIDYPEKNPGILDPAPFGKFRFKNLQWKYCIEFILFLKNCAGIKVTRTNQDLPEVEVFEESIEIIQNGINNYLEKFISGELIPIDKNYLNFEKQKKYFLEKIKTKLENETSKTLFLSDNEIENEYDFFESMLALERQKYLKIKSVTNSQKPESSDFYKIVFTIRSKFHKKVSVQNKKVRRLSVKCFSKGNLGYFRVKKESKEKIIGKANSRPFLLLQFLVNQGIGEIVSFQKAFKAIKDGKHYKTTSHLVDEELAALINARKVLQKERKIHPFKLIIGKKDRTIRMQ